jgi:hypothetical protein
MNNIENINNNNNNSNNSNSSNNSNNSDSILLELIIDKIILDSLPINDLIIHSNTTIPFKYHCHKHDPLVFFTLNKNSFTILFSDAIPLTHITYNIDWNFFFFIYNSNKYDPFFFDPKIYKNPSFSYKDFLLLLNFSYLF